MCITTRQSCLFESDSEYKGKNQKERGRERACVWDRNIKFDILSRQYKIPMSHKIHYHIRFLLNKNMVAIMHFRNVGKSLYFIVRNNNWFDSMINGWINHHQYVDWTILQDDCWSKCNEANLFISFLSIYFHIMCILSLNSAVLS